MSNSESNRLDRIEAILLQVAQQQQVNTQTIQQNSVAIAELRQELGESISQYTWVKDKS